MRIVEEGLLFSGPTAYLSTMYPAGIEHDNKNYKSNEQCFQCTKAQVHDKLGLAATMKEMSNAYDIKENVADIVTTEEWNRFRYRGTGVGFIKIVLSLKQP